jgi:hypothetical protein
MPIRAYRGVLHHIYRFLVYTWPSIGCWWAMLATANVASSATCSTRLRSHSLASTSRPVPSPTWHGHGHGQHGSVGRSSTVCNTLQASESAVTVQDLYVEFGKGIERRTVLKGTSLKIKRGSLHMLLGPNGCGKVCAMTCIAMPHASVWNLWNHLHVLCPGWHAPVIAMSCPPQPRLPPPRILLLPPAPQSTLLKVLGGLVAPSSGSVQLDQPTGFVFQNPDHQVVMPTVAADVAFGLGRCAAARHACLGLMEQRGAHGQAGWGGRGRVLAASSGVWHASTRRAFTAGHVSLAPVAAARCAQVRHGRV